MATKYIVISTLLGLNYAKICWKECGNENVIEVIKFVDEIKRKMLNMVFYSLQTLSGVTEGPRIPTDKTSPVTEQWDLRVSLRGGTRCSWT